MRITSAGREQRLFGLTVLVVVFCLCFAANADEFIPFRTTGIDSHIILRYLADESPGFEQSRLEESIFVTTRNYVYHPSFLKLDLGGSVGFFQDSFESENDSSNSDGDSYSLRVNGRLLEKKSYPMRFNYSHDRPFYSSNVDDPLKQTSTRYGFDLVLLQPLLPFQMDWFANHEETRASSASRLVDESSDSFGFKALVTYDNDFSQRISMERDEINSGSGSSNTPINPTLRTTDFIRYNSDMQFGEENQLRYADSASVTEFSGVVTGEELRFNPLLRWKHSETTRSFYSYSYFDTSLNGNDSGSQLANATINHVVDDQIRVEGKITADDRFTSGSESQSAGLEGGISFKQPLSNGSLQLAGDFSYRGNDRAEFETVSNVIGENITLSGLTPVALSNDFIVTSSIVIQNLARSQTYSEGFDYRVIVVGNRTEIQRLTGGSILDPEQVVTDYVYQTGGSASYTSLGQTYFVGLSLGRSYDFNLRYSDTDQVLKSGNPTIPLQDSKDLSFSARSNFQLNRRISLGGDIDLVKHEEDITPYDRQEYVAFGQFILPGFSQLNLRAGRIKTDYGNIPQDTDRSTFSMVLGSQPHARLWTTVEAYFEKDSSDALSYKRNHLKFNARWRFYQLFLNAEATFRNEKSGTTETNDNRILITLRRNL